MLSLYSAILLTILVCHHLNTYMPMHILGIVVTAEILARLVRGANKSPGRPDDWR